MKDGDMKNTHLPPASGKKQEKIEMTDPPIHVDFPEEFFTDPFFAD